MSEHRSEDDRCLLCGTALPDSESSSNGQFCSAGCREIHDVYGSPTDHSQAGDQPAPFTVKTGPEQPLEEQGGEHGDADSSQREPNTDDGEQPSTDTDESNASSDSSEDDTEEEPTLVRTFFRVDGMHSATCESFLEATAESQAGVVDAAGSYITETVRVDHDQAVIAKQALRDKLSRVGYTAYLREEATAGEAGTGGTRRAREMTGLRKRRSDDMLEFRYIIGVVFGLFLMLPYATLLYPIYLAELVDSPLLALYADDFETQNALIYLQIFIVMTALIIYATGKPLLRSTYVSLRRRQPTTGVLALVTAAGAYLYSTVAVVTGHSDIYFDLAIAVTALVMAAIFYEATVKRRALNRLTDLTISQVDEARRLEPDGTTEMVGVSELEAGDRVLVQQGERIPVDGRLVDSTCTVDEAVITGESLPRSKVDGDAVVGGSVVTTDAAVVEVGTETTSSIDQLMRTVWNLQSADHGAQRRADELAAKALPVVGGAVGLAVIVGLLSGFALTSVLLLALGTAMVVSPWALGFATRLSVAASIEEALEAGIVVFDETVFERLRAIDTVVFDKTGTLTTGSMTVLEADAPEALLSAAGTLEQRAAHPAGEAIAAAFAAGSEDEAQADSGGPRPSASTSTLEVEEFHSHTTGVEGVVDGQQVLAGHPKLFGEQGWTLEAEIDNRVQAARDEGHLPVVVGRDGVAEGVIVVGDEPRTDWEETVDGFRDLEVVVLTGDDQAATDLFERHPAVDHVFAGISPAGKVATIRRLTADRQVAMVGDGTNDAPALAEADLGISLGSGTALASDAADLAIVNETLGAVGRAFGLAEGTQTRLERTLMLSLSYNVLVIPAALLGLLNPLIAIVAVGICCLLVVWNVS